MANNRMYLQCTVCQEEVYLAKWFPSQGWYFNKSKEEMGTDLDRFLDRHDHIGDVLDGEWFKIIFENQGGGAHLMPKEK